MEVHLNPDQEAFIQHRVSEGAYASPDQAIRAAVDLLEERDGYAASFHRSPATGAELVAAMQASPYKGILLEPYRPPMPVRDVTL